MGPASDNYKKEAKQERAVPGPVNWLNPIDT